MSMFRHGSLFALLFLSDATAALAHHSHASLDPDDVRVLSGIVTRYSWSMPHVYLKVEAPNLDGEIVEYSIELLHPGAMAAQGWDKDTFAPGDRITWRGEHDRNKTRAYSSLEWAERDGVRIGQGDDGTSQPIAPSTDFTGMWNRGPNQPTYFPPQGWPLTDKGAALVANFSEEQNPVLECHDPGPPKSMTLPYAHRLRYQDANTLVIERDLMEGKRVVYLDRTAPPGAPSKLGHSEGWFENGDLIVETTNFIADRWGTHTGIDSSEQKQVRERFRLTDGGLGIEITTTVTDPVYLREPATFTHRWVKVAERELVVAPCTMESARLWVEGGL
ncbi:MAG: DUF6152 family protein [Gammaproteobacteria bacterium]